MNDQCPRCGGLLELYAGDWPWNPDQWVCTQCDSAYSLEEI